MGTRYKTGLIEVKYPPFEEITWHEENIDFGLHCQVTDYNLNGLIRVQFAVLNHSMSPYIEKTIFICM